MYNVVLGLKITSPDLFDFVPLPIHCQIIFHGSESYIRRILLTFFYCDCFLAYKSHLIILNTFSYGMIVCIFLLYFSGSSKVTLLSQMKNTKMQGYDSLGYINIGEIKISAL